MFSEISHSEISKSILSLPSQHYSCYISQVPGAVAQMWSVKMVLLEIS